MRILPFVAVAAMAGVASADTVDLKEVGVGAGANVTINVGSSGKGVFAGQIMHQFTNGTGTAAAWSGTTGPTFCIEIAETTTKSPLTYTLQPLSTVPGIPGAMGPGAAQAVSRLYDLASGAQFATGSSDANRDAAAFQIALWELVFDFDAGEAGGNISLTDSSGYFEYDPAVKGVGSIWHRANSWLADIFSSYHLASTALKGLHHNGQQDQVVMVPLPAPVLMGLAGLVAVAGVRRLRK